MSWALTALILIRVHARPGEWLTIDELASHLAVAPREVRVEANTMWRGGTLQIRCDGPAGEISHCSAQLRSTKASA